MALCLITVNFHILTNESYKRAGISVVRLCYSKGVQKVQHTNILIFTLNVRWSTYSKDSKIFLESCHIRLRQSRGKEEEGPSEAGADWGDWMLHGWVGGVYIQCKALCKQHMP